MLAFDRAGSGGSDIWVMNADGSGAHSLIATNADELEPGFAPGPIRTQTGLVVSRIRRTPMATTRSGRRMSMVPTGST